MSRPRDLGFEFSRRTLMAAAAGGAIWTGLLARLFQLQVLESDRYVSLAAENRVRLDLAPPPRGRILDRFGIELASHRVAGRVTLTPERTENVRTTLSRIADLIELSDPVQTRILRDIGRQPRFVPTIIANELTFEDFARMQIHAASLPGVDVEMASTRSYPRGRDFAHVLGYVARASERDLQRLTDGKTVNEREFIRRLFKHPDMRTGRSGIEFRAEGWLRGDAGSRRVVTNAAGRIIEELPSDDLAPIPGKDVRITIDAELQRFAIERFADESGAAVVMDIDSGDILAFVSTPAYDPNDFVNGISQADYDLLRANDRSPLYHKAYDGLYPPGSTFKMVTAAAALATGAVAPERRVNCPGHYRFGNRTWHCWKPGGHGSVDMHAAIKGSCDTYFYEIARLTGISEIADMARKFGFGHRWELGITGGREGVVPDDPWKRETLNERWYEGETLNVGIGQGYLNASPLQLAVMTARIAAEGRIIVPNLIVDGPKPETPTGASEPLDADIMRRMKAGMFGVTSEYGGTARSSGDLGLGGPRLAGKTGTAQVRRITEAERRSGVLKGEALDRKLRDHALFVAYAPADNPKYAIGVVVEHGEGGSSAAAPVARDIIAHAIRTESGRAPTRLQTASLATGGFGGGAP
ncbi:MAG: penicillin-binding protein 2 [Pseudomonadota bacterium]